MMDQDLLCITDVEEEAAGVVVDVDAAAASGRDRFSSAALLPAEMAARAAAPAASGGISPEPAIPTTLVRVWICGFWCGNVGYDPNS
jgi:hypothetical protein